METDLDIAEKRKRCKIALSINYLRIVRGFLCTVSGWPYEELCEDLPRCFQTISSCYMFYLPVQEFFLFSTSVYYISVNELDLLAFGQDLMGAFLTFMALVRLFLPFFKEFRQIVGEFLVTFHLVHFKDKGHHFKKVYTFVEKFSLYLTIYNCITMLLGGLMFNVAPHYTNYRNGAFFRKVRANITYDFSIFWSLPSFNQADHFIPVSLFNIMVSYNCGVIICIIDLLLSLMVIQIIGHIVILRKNLESIRGPEEMENMNLDMEFYQIQVNTVKYSKNENEYVKGVIVDFVHHHKRIVSFTGRMSECFGPILLLNYSFHLISLCILLLECTTGGFNSFARFGPLTLIIFGQLIQISVTFEIVGTVSEKLPDSLYSIPWECMDIRNQRSMCILLQRLQRSIHITALGMTNVGVTTMAKILKTTFSYFAFLRSMDA